MEPTITDGSLVEIDHSKREIKLLTGKIVAIRIHKRGGMC
jgi:hypothetical protein